MRKLIVACSMIALLAAGVVSPVHSAEWGDLKLQFVLDGKAPAAAPLKADKDPAVCAVKPILAENLVVGSTGGIENVIVFLVPEKGAKLGIHPDYEKEKTTAVELDNKGCKFIPHVALIRTGQTLKLKNSDPVGHNSKLDFTSNLPQNPIIPGMSAIEVKDLTKPEKRATPVTCSIHTWMNAWVLVQDHPYMAKSNADGELVMKNIPTGSFTFQVWHEELGNISDKNATKDGKAVAWTKGKAVLTIKAGANDIGTIKVKP